MHPPSAKRLLASGLILGGLGFALCACGTAQNTGDDLVVQKNGQQPAHLTLPQLQRLPQVDVATPQSHGAKMQRGPTVRSILSTAGATQVERVRVDGRDPSQTLTASELTDKVILCLTKRNALKLAGTDLGIERWVRDVTTLVVDP